MLVITRRKGQRIVLGNDIEIIVSGINGSTVRLAVVAPRSVPVLRGEVFEQVRELNQAALGTELDGDFDLSTAQVAVEVTMGGLEAEDPSLLPLPSVTALAEK